MSLRIIPFQQQHSIAFQDLNVAWLEEYFYVEDKDKMLLENCKESIIDKGGYIFIAEYKGHIVGCFSFIPFTKNTYELGKMAVDSNYQGLRIGQGLLNYAITFAQSNNWEAIVLYSSTKLPTALHIYEKYGFQEVELEKDLPYERSDIKMELKLGRF